MERFSHYKVMISHFILCKAETFRSYWEENFMFFISTLWRDLQESRVKKN